ncbi:hypothetical protein [Massilia varians]|uniref:hypothetical protein n=1 Tax=Massilia varians TaxID=457921 RepID=UPI0025549B1A|nr:hypothetical protein [Massilia varians]MDK6077932.1 hypothetical protein [Massilia varians]
MYKSWMWKQRSFREQFQGDEGGASAGGAAAADQAGSDDQGAQQGGDADQQGERQAAAAAPDAAAQDDGEVTITFGDEPPPAANEDEVDGKPAPQWVKDLRRQTRELQRENRELKQAQQAAQQQTAPAAPVVGEKPTLEGCEFDPDRFETELTAWHERKRKADEVAAAARQEQEAAQAAWTAKLTAYNTAKTALRVDDFDGAEHVVRETLSQTQQGVILSGADKPELLVYAIGRNPAKAKELAAIKDPVKFAFAVAKLETQLKVTPRKEAPPAPERQVRGNAGGATSIDNVEARLEAEADRTGNRTALINYRKQKKNQVAA